MNSIKTTVVPLSWKNEFPEEFKRLDEKFVVEVFDDSKIIQKLQ